MAKEIKSPCIDVCQFKGDVCVGCGRSKAEIKAWHGMKRKDRMLTDKRAQERMKKLGRTR